MTTTTVTAIMVVVILLNGKVELNRPKSIAPRGEKVRVRVQMAMPSPYRRNVSTALLGGGGWIGGWREVWGERLVEAVNFDLLSGADAFTRSTIMD